MLAWSRDAVRSSSTPTQQPALYDHFGTVRSNLLRSLVGADGASTSTAACARRDADGRILFDQVDP